jgi:hypothetical protein
MPHARSHPDLVPVALPAGACRALAQSLPPDVRAAFARYGPAAFQGYAHLALLRGWQQATPRRRKRPQRRR